MRDIISYMQTPRPGIKESREEGKKLRERFPRQVHAQYNEMPGRKDPIAILDEQNKSRVQRLVPIRFSRMLTSPFAYLRGSAAVMANDLSFTPITGIAVQACGDMHVSNFGVYASAERQLIFGINDFDETHPGPWEWDLKRLAASAVVSARYIGADKVQCEEAAHSLVRSYREWMWRFSEMGHIELWYTHIDDKDLLAVLSKEARKKASLIFKKARMRNHMQVLGKLTDLVDDNHLIKEEAPFVVREQFTDNGTPMQKALELFLEEYLHSLPDDRKYLVSQYQVIDVARKVVGVGSVGTSCWVVFLKGRTNNDPLFLQVKEAPPSVLEPYVSSTYHNSNGKRVVMGQRLLQGSPDIFLGYGNAGGKDFYVRQLRDMKGGLEIVPGKNNPNRYPEYTALCGWALALAHAKSGNSAMLSGYMGKSETLDDAIVAFSMKYADQTERDFEQLTKAAKEGLIPVGETK